MVYKPVGDEKVDYDTKQIEDGSPGPESLSDVSHDQVYSQPEQRRIIQRVDLRLVTTCGVMYCISLMDRTNLPSAAIAGYDCYFPHRNEHLSNVYSMTKQLRLDIGYRYVRILVPSQNEKASDEMSSHLLYLSSLFHT